MNNHTRGDHAAHRPLRRRDDVSALVHAAIAGDERTWGQLMEHFDAMIRAVARRHGLGPADCDDVAQQTWVQLFLHIRHLHNHAALPGWLRTTAQRESWRVVAAARREVPSDEPAAAGTAKVEEPGVDDQLLAAERRDAVRDALRRAPRHERRLVELMLAKPSMSYDDLSGSLGIPRGSIGPTRGRCIARLRGDARLASVIGAPVAARRSSSHTTGA